VIRYVEHVSPAAASGRVAEIYRQIRRDFGAVPDLAALAPHQIDDTVVAAYRRHEPVDRRLLALLAWSSAQAARRIGTWSTA
jgi:hypothetical protein